MFYSWSLRKDEFIDDCSDLDDIILFLKWKMIVTKLLTKICRKGIYILLFGKRR